MQTNEFIPTYCPRDLIHHPNKIWTLSLSRSRLALSNTGLVRLVQPFIVVEFSKWSWRKMSKEIKEVRIPMSEVVSVEFITRVLETRLDIQLRSMKTAVEIPSNKPGLVQLQFTKRYRKGGVN